MFIQCILLRKNAYYTGSKDFATKTKGAMAYFIAVSGMIFIEKSNQEPCIKQIKRFMNLWHGYVKIMILWELMENPILQILDYNGKEDLVMKKFDQNMKILMFKKDNNNFWYVWFIIIMVLL